MTDIDLSALDRELKKERPTWDEFVEAVRLVTRGEHA